MRLQDVSRISAVFDGEHWDVDRYAFETGNREYSVDVDFDRHEIRGDVIAFGESGRLDNEDAEKLLYLFLLQHPQAQRRKIMFWKHVRVNKFTHNFIYQLEVRP